MLLASIDIGSNAARLLLANVFDTTQEPSSASHVAFVRVPLRLGEDVFHDGMISEPRIANLVKTLKAFQLLVDVYAPDDFVICATAAMREAANREEILNRVKKENGLTIRVIDGQEEATIIRESNRLFSKYQDETLMYVDVGGGSTEIMFNTDLQSKSEESSAGILPPVCGQTPQECGASLSRRLPAHGRQKNKLEPRNLIASRYHYKKNTARQLSPVCG